MANINLKYPGPIGTKYQRALEALALQQGCTVEDVLEATLKGIAQQMGVDFNDTDDDQDASLKRAENRGTKAKQAREDRAAEAARLQAESDQRRADEESKAVEPTEPTPAK